MHPDDCRRRLEEAIKNDDILKVRLDVKDIRGSTEWSSKKLKEGMTPVVQVEKMDAEMQIYEAEVASEL